ncbi:MAG: hypothetical protein FJ318_06585 [SAR202 cluster bacterium]|nr:hypothetical protein [SAR202 cluster bacterium]
MAGRLFSWLIGIAIVEWIAMLLIRANRERAAMGRKHYMVTQGCAEFRAVDHEADDALASVMQGGMVFDFRGVRRGAASRKLDVFVIMGGLEVLVPEDWNVRLEVEPMMGGVRDARGRMPSPDEQLDLSISGRALMGGVEVSAEKRVPMRKQAGHEQQPQRGMEGRAAA